MDNLSYQLLSHEIFSFSNFLHIRNRHHLIGVDFKDLILNGVESPPRQNSEMPVLWIFTYNSINQFSCMIVDLELLVCGGVTAAVQDCLFDNFSNVSFLILYVDSGAILFSEAVIVISHPFIWSMLIIIEACNSPSPVRCRQEKSLHKTDLLLQSQINISLLLVHLVTRNQLILVGKVTRHERKPNWQGKGQSIIAVFQRISLLVEDKVTIIFQPTPIKYHKNIITLVITGIYQFILLLIITCCFLNPKNTIG